MDDIYYYCCGDSSILIKLSNSISEDINIRVRLLDKAINALDKPGIIETIPAYCTIMVLYKPEVIRYRELIDFIKDLSKDIAADSVQRHEVVEIPVLYGGEFGPDIKFVAEHNNLAVDEVIRIHSSTEYLIYMLGFTPGFPYLGGMDKKIATPRLEKPRVRLEAGSVGIAGEQTGIYPVASPGGWQIIGQTPLDLYDSQRDEPILLKAGQYIKFKPIDKDEFDEIRSKNKYNLYDGISIKKDNIVANNCIVTSNNIETNNKIQSDSGIRFISSGLMTTVQDLGRYGYQASGVSVSGAMDKRSLMLANLLVGNDIGEACLEVTMIGPVIEFKEDNIIAITGGYLMPFINNRPVAMYKSILCHKCDIISFKGIKAGIRAYIAFAGGFNIPDVMGSKSTYIKGSIGGINGRKIDHGDKVGFCNPEKYIHNYEHRYISRDKQFVYSDEINLRVVLGPEDDMFTEKGIHTFLEGTYTVSNEFDRMGCRLNGNRIEHKGDGNIISNGIALGAIQVPSHGEPIIMMADRQTVGGYTKIANVISVDLPKLAQAKPGDRIKFIKVSIEEAQSLYMDEIKEINYIKNMLDNTEINQIKHYNIHVNNKDYDVLIEEINK